MVVGDGVRPRKDLEQSFMSTDRRIEPEELLARAFMPWFKATTGYDERLEDIDTRFADPVDSAGYLSGNTLLIELKNRVNGGSIAYEGSNGSSIEKKICTALSQLYSETENRLNAALSGWYSGREPIFALVANHFSKRALTELRSLLRQRSMEWRFGYEVLVWTGQRAKSLMKQEPSRASLSELQSIELPNMPSTAPRRGKRMSDEACIDAAIDQGLERVLEAFHRKLNENDAVRKAQIHNITYSFPSRNRGDKRTVFAIWPGHFDRSKGILIAYQQRRLRECFDVPEELDLERDVPGQRGPAVGHLSTERYLTTVDDVELFWKILKGCGNSSSS